ncbi:ATP-binding protein [Oscillochloris sp. ZM17-4]|uniref:bifunctional RecB family nuclease/DEAD/DEAH box helicase n=1 Tax=Oscillochloris sp. ZM17-4 TaxID=2866714 RepID=UPI001C739B66|nr:ATP-binding protein [Oscillochloris sp. ZM17-4]MBX0328599.1 ATP-binding protein [Oscillochloris sp. ZM17-4]
MASSDFIPLIPAAAGEPRRISPTDVAQYIRLDQCRRYLRLRLHERAFGPSFMTRYGVAPQSIPPILTLSGADFEGRVEAAAALCVGEAINCRAAALAGDDEFIGPDHNAVVVERARALPPGAALLLFQPRLRVAIGPWELRGDVDILRLERDASGDLRALIIDMKSSTAAKVEHRLQVAFYHEMLAALMASADLLIAAIATGILYRGPAAGAGALNPAEQARLDAQRAEAARLFGVEDAYFELVADPDAYREEVRDLVTGEAAVAADVAAAPFAALAFHLTYKCDGCLYNEFCMKWAAEHDDLSLIPYLSDTEKNALRAGGVTTTSDLAGLKVFPDDSSPDLVTPPERRAAIQTLSASRAVGPRLDELVHRARRYRRWRGDDLRALTYIPSKGYGTLPAVDAGLHPNLVRVYIDVQHDYLHERVYLLGALVAACADGQEDPARRRSVVRMGDGRPEEPAQERDLLVGWVAETVRAIVELAAPDAEGLRRAPIHLIFGDQLAQRALLDALSRHFGSVIGAAPLYDFITQIAGFDSPVVTLLDAERRELKNDPLVCPSLQALARHNGFDWGEYRAIFRARMFDDVGKLDEDAEGAGAWYTSRARFSSQIPLEYAYAAWGDLPPPKPAGHDDLAVYRRADRAAMLGFQARRLEAMEHLARDFRGNRQTEKTPFDLPDLAAFAQAARSLADALHEFLTLERHTVMSAWKAAHLPPPERRVLAGASLVLRYDEADQAPELLAALAENARRRALRQSYSAAFLAANPKRKRATLTAEQSEETQPLPITWPFRLRIDLDGVDCALPTALNLTGFAAGEQVIVAPRWSVDERLPPEERRPFTPTAKQLLYQPRARIVAIDPAGLVDVTPTPGFGGDKKYTFGYQPFAPAAGEVYTMEADPSDIYGQRCMAIVEELRLGAHNTLYARLDDPAGERVSWPAAAVAAQRRFAEGLDALREAGALHAFDPSQIAYIAQHGDAPTLLVQGPPGTGKSYTTAFALLARLQGALAAGQTFRALLTCKTHAATDVLLEQVAKVQAELGQIRRERPELFAAHFDSRILSAPLFRVNPRDPTKEWPGPVGVLTKDNARDAIRAQQACFAAITPFATATICKVEKSFTGQDFCDCLVLDEASQMNLPEAAMAALPLRATGQLIIVGDHRQMPPIIQHGWSDERRRTFQTYRAYASLFETMLAREPAPPMVQFAESFRLHREIARFLRDAIYQQDGIDYHSNQTATLATVAHADAFLDAVLSPDHPLVVIVHEEDGSQVLNPFELRLVSPILQALAGGHGLNASHGLGVVVPHRAQRAALKAALPGLMDDLLDGGLDDSAVDTVERFQGGERTAILVSATESDRDYLRSAGEFLLDPRRLNVALSRAKQKLILVASRSVFTIFNTDEEAFAHAQLWKQLLRRTCTAPLWEGVREGVRVQVWGNRA